MVKLTHLQEISSEAVKLLRSYSFPSIEEEKEVSSIGGDIECDQSGENVRCIY